VAGVVQEERAAAAAALWVARVKRREFFLNIALFISIFETSIDL
jgi:hypothetical protein